MDSSTAQRIPFRTVRATLTWMYSTPMSKCSAHHDASPRHGENTITDAASSFKSCLSTMPFPPLHARSTFLAIHTTNRSAHFVMPQSIIINVYVHARECDLRLIHHPIRYQIRDIRERVRHGLYKKRNHGEMEAHVLFPGISSLSSHSTLTDDRSCASKLRSGRPRLSIARARTWQRSQLKNLVPGVAAALQPTR